MNPLWPLSFLFLLVILQSFSTLWLIRVLVTRNQQLESLRNQRESDLLNRLMTKEWQSYQSLTLSQSNQILLQDGEGIGLSDDNEMRRVAELLGQQYPVGETLVETGLR